MASIRHRAGHWQARVTRRGYASEAKTFNSKEDAVKWATALEREMDQGSFVSRSLDDNGVYNQVRYA